MMPYQSYEIAKARVREAQESAEARRSRRAALNRAAYGVGVIDAVGHGLIAIGSRLVSDPTDHPTHRRAA
ncbi:MAG TPA: hypothetical protein VJ938_00730 [Acidimicrobiia bacterium]|nr:hypothetical protein [Acidimicrobiia bacterium]